MNLKDAINGKLDTELNVVFQKTFEPRSFVIYKPIYGDWGYYREKGAGYTTRDRAWRVTEQEGKLYVSGRLTDSDRAILQPAPQLDYINALESLGLVHEVEKNFTLKQWDKYLPLFTNHSRPTWERMMKAMHATARTRVINILLTVKPEVFTS